MKPWRVIIIIGIITILILAVPFSVKLSVGQSIFQKSTNLPHKEFAIVLGAGVKKMGSREVFLNTD